MHKRAQSVYARAMANRLGSLILPMGKLPGPLRTRALSLALGNAVPFVGTAGITITELTESRCTATLVNGRAVRNHIGGLHAAAMTLLAETVTGLVVGMNVPDDRVPVVKSLAVQFKKRAKGNLRAIATLTETQRAEMHSLDKGEVQVAVKLTDDDGAEPLEATMIWAWTKKRN
jgi:acyl-coenzyme A thioesterase PaaI-like protein